MPNIRLNAVDLNFICKTKILIEQQQMLYFKKMKRASSKRGLQAYDLFAV